MSSQPMQITDQLTLLTPLGFRFWDEVSGRTIGDGLVVTAHPANNPNKRVTAAINRSNVYILQNLPGMRAIENSKGDAAFWQTVVPRQFVIEVQDILGRFLPFSFVADVPSRGLFSWKNEPILSPPAASLVGIPLYSAPTRIIAGGMAVIRAELYDSIAQAPAAWAWLEAQIGGSGPHGLKIRSFADALGRISLIFPYPEPPTFIPGSPVNVPGLPLTQQQWAVTFQAGYNRQDSTAAFPNLADILNQPLAKLWLDTSRTQPLGEVTLNFGQTLTLRSTDVSGASPTPLSVLLITPAA